jgi:hypothetical protein
VSLAGRTLRSSRYVYVVAPSATSVAFYLDDQRRAHRPLQVEHSAPFDLRGTFYGKARPWRVWGVVTGPHTLTVVATLSNGTKLVKSVRFHVSGKANPVYRTGFSVTRHAARTHAHGLAGHALRGKVYVYLSARRLANVSSVTFYVDDPHHKYPAARRDRHRPFDLVGSSGSRAVALDTRLMLRGSHTLQAVIRWRDGTVTTRLVHFHVVR